MFHYRNQGADYGRILAGLQVPEEDYGRFDEFLKNLGYSYVEETNNPAIKTIITFFVVLFIVLNFIFFKFKD